MAKLNMVLKNTLFRKGYLLAVVIMAANMFAVNEMKAMEENNKEKENITPNDNWKLIPVEDSNKLDYINKKYENASFLIKGVLYRVLSSENYINLIGGVISSVANNYLKWWDYNPGKYSKLGCLGWRSGRLIKDIFQFDINLNLGRGAFWLVPGIIDFFIPDENRENKFLDIMCTSFNVRMIIFINFKSEIITTLSLISQTAVFLLQGFVSVPLAIHISNFSISISLDSILWAGIGKFLEPEVNNDGENKDINAKLNNTIGEKMIEMEDVNNEVENNKNKIFQIKNKTTKRANN